METYPSHNYTLEFKFPFSTGKVDLKPNINTYVERVEGIVSFKLEFNLDISIPNAVLKSKEKTGQHTIYVFEFDTLDDCLNWMKHPEIFVESKKKNGDVYLIQKQMDDFMREYEENELKRKTKRKKLIDEDGFEYYE